LIPTLATAANIVGTIRPRWHAVVSTPPGHALIWGTALLVVAGVQAALLPLSIVETAVRNTQWVVAAPLTALVGGCTFLLFAGIYHLLPMLRHPADRPGTPLYGVRVARWHLFLSSLGAVLYIAGLWYGGTAQVLARAIYGSGANMAAALWPALMLQAAALGLLLAAQVFLVYTVAKAASAPQPYKLPVILVDPR